MIVFAQNSHSRFYTDKQVNEKFLELLPAITATAKRAFRMYDPDRRDDAVQSVVVAAFQNIKQLAANGKLDEAFATPLAVYGIKGYRCGRIGGVSQSSTDVFAERCRWLNRSKVVNYGIAEGISDTFESEASAVDARYPVHRVVEFRIDFFETWLKTRSERDQKVIGEMAMGATTGEIAKKYGVSPGAVSQWRKRFADSWNEFINPAKNKGENDLSDINQTATATTKRPKCDKRP